MKASIKKRLAVGVKLLVVSFESKKYGRYPVKSKAEILEKAMENPAIKDFRIVSENPDIFEVSYIYDCVPERLSAARVIDTVQTNAIRFEGGSWLYYGPAAQSELTEKGFKVWEIDREGNICDVIEYEFCE